MTDSSELAEALERLEREERRNSRLEQAVAELAGRRGTEWALGGRNDTPAASEIRSEHSVEKAVIGEHWDGDPASLREWLGGLATVSVDSAGGVWLIQRGFVFKVAPDDFVWIDRRRKLHVGPALDDIDYVLDRQQHTRTTGRSRLRRQASA